MKKYILALSCIAIIFLGVAVLADTTPDNTLIPTPVARDSLIDQDIQRFGIAIQIVRKYYVETVPDEKLFNNAIRGLLEGLDPHSTYLSAEDLKNLKDATRGEFSGLGIEIAPANGYLKVVTPLDDSPAQKAGVKAGDYIIRIDDSFIKDMDMTEAVKKMRGPKGSAVYITVMRSDQPKPLRLKIIRDDIHVQSVKSRLLQEGYGYVRISAFQDNTDADFRQVIKNLQKGPGGLKGLVLDLRNNPGGLLDAAVAVTDDMLEAKDIQKNNLIVYTKGRVPGADIKIEAKPDDILNDIPLVILINEGSASGAEIVAGALQDHKRAVIVGTKSFGKGSVQTVIPIDADSAIKLTTALYYTPSGRSIQASGIRPDILVKDIKVPASNKTEDQVPEYVKEADLKGHLANGNGKLLSLAEQTEKESASNMELATTDYQLFEALNILKGLVAAHTKPQQALSVLHGADNS